MITALELEALVEEATELLKEACVIPAPSHHEEQRVDFITSWLRKEGVEDFHVDEAMNVIISINDDGACPLDVFAAHTDVVFPDTTALPMREDGSLLHCPGVGDDTASFVALMLYARALQRGDIKAKGGVLCVCNTCEEGLGNLKGVRQLFDDYGGRIRSFTSFDSNLGGIVTEAVGSERYEISVRTKGGHSFADFGADNAIAQLSSLISKLYKQDVRKDRHVTYNVGTVTGGTSVNTIAQDASCTYEYRALDEKDLSTMRCALNVLISGCKARGWDIGCRCIGQRPCGIETDQSRLVEAVRPLMEEAGLSTRMSISSTDCNIPLSLGIPAICFGLIRFHGAHTREEYVELDSYPTGLKLGWDYISKIVG